MKPQVLLQAELLAGVHQLGQSTATYRGEWRPLVKLSLGCTLVFVLAMATYSSIEVIGSGNQITPGEQATIFTILLGLFCFALLVLFVSFWYRWVSPRYVLYYAEGCVYVQGRKVQAVRWDEVETFQEVKVERRNPIEIFWHLLQWVKWVRFTHTIPYLPPYPFSLRTRQGKTFQFRSTFLNLARARAFADLGERFDAEMELANRVEREVSMRLWEKAVTAYQAGLPVTFGKLQISAQGVRKGRKMRSWDEIDSLALENTEGVIREFKRPEPSPETPEEAGVALPPTDLETHLAVTYWQEEVGPLALIILQMKEECRDEHTLNRGWYVSEVPNALVFVALIAYALHQH